MMTSARIVLGLALLCTLFVVTSSRDLDGGWSPWSSMATPCSKSCGGGINHRVRSCTHPVPSGAGKLCTAEDSTEKEVEWKTYDCNTQSCWANEWTEFGNCSKECGRGFRYRRAVCGNVTCEGDQSKVESEKCNTWNKTACPSPCEEMSCPEYGVCKDNSTELDPIAFCVCTMGYQMNSDKTSCIRPPPTTPTPRPIPTLPAEQKVVATVISKSASTIIIIFLTITLILFFLMRIFTPDRVIQMNMEIALLLAHAILMFPFMENETLCRVISILIHYFFTACFIFMMLESLHMYSLVAYVVKKDGMFTRLQNTLIGWGLAAFIIMFCMCFEYDNYGGEYHCWLRMDTPLLYGQFIPVVGLVIMTFTLIEAAGAAEYKPLKGIDKTQLLSARISQRTNLIILPLVFAHWMVGMMSEYEQNLPLYGTFSVLNGITGGVIFFLHCTNNSQVRAKLTGIYKSMCKGSSAR
ncbi:adhesion G-protein coupled receptor D1-like [Penaeus indicus]|uniref:adhesion G-protein coupled receptor D1-like n=1 Tax=Penaeus indicus TaxID=29960 RepID=UPI00300D9606